MPALATDPAIRYKSHFGVYGAAVKGTGADRHILLIRKQRGPYTGLLDLPGGTPEPHELLEETLRREVLEETGCAVVNCKAPRAVSALFPYTSTTDGLAYTLRHLGALFPITVRGEPHTTLNDLDSAGADWYAVDKLLDYEITPFVRIALERKRNEKYICTSVTIEHCNYFSDCKNRYL